jgi:hypothetical protein
MARFRRFGRNLCFLLVLFVTFDETAYNIYINYIKNLNIFLKLVGKMTKSARMTYLEILRDSWRRTSVEFSQADSLTRLSALEDITESRKIG